ncbi:MAG TPA: hypothetical protein PK156_28170 [Polyangium sp.]|nr:hypothetical protein [Polyangium sp.]
MATARTTRSSATNSSIRGQSREGGEGSSEKKRRLPRPKKHTHFGTPRARSSAAILHALAQIKRQLIDGEPCHIVIDDFFERVTSEPAFAFEFRGGPHWLREAVARSCEDIVGQPHGHSTVFLTTVPEYALVHGSVTLGDFTGTVIYFEDIRLGAIGLFPLEPWRGAYFLRLVIMDEPEDPRDAPN